MIGITGSKGLVASQLAVDLSQENKELIFFSRTRTTREYEHVALDLLDPEKNLNQIRKGLEKVKTLYHLASCLPGTNYSTSEYLQSNLLATDILFNAAASAGVQHFIYMSSANILSGKDGYIQDDSAYIDDRHLSGYLLSKKHTELMLRKKPKHRIKVTIFRTGTIYGARMNSGFHATLLRNILNNHPTHVNDDGSWASDMVYISDVTKSLSLLKEGEYLPTILNLGSGFQTSIREMADCILKSLGAPKGLVRYKTGTPPQKESLPAIRTSGSLLGSLKKSTSLREGVREMLALST